MTFLISLMNISDDEEEGEVGKPEVASAFMKGVVSLPEVTSEETVVPEDPRRPSFPELPSSAS